jgi:hypothetical protein
MMFDVINQLEMAIMKDHKLLLQMRLDYRHLVEELANHQRTIKGLRVDSRLVGESTGDVNFLDFADVKLKVSNEYATRIGVILDAFREFFPYVLYYLKKTRLHISIARTLVRHQFDILDQPGLMEAVSSNFKMIVETIKNLSDHIGKMQLNMAAARELSTQTEVIVIDLRKRLAPLQREVNMYQDDSKKKLDESDSKQLKEAAGEEGEIEDMFDFLDKPSGLDDLPDDIGFDEGLLKDLE